MAPGYTLLALAAFGQTVRTDANGLRFFGKNEVVMAPGMRITAKTSVGTISITADSPLGRSYTWEGATRSLEMEPRGQRWYGSMGLYFPGPGDHWAEHNGITRAVVEESQARLHSLTEFKSFVAKNSYHPLVYRNDGLMVSWGKVLGRRQLDVEVWQIVINGRKPTYLQGANDQAIKVGFVNLKRSPLVELVQKHNLKLLRTEITKKVDVNAADASGTTPLIAAVRAADAAATKMLLKAGANPNVESPDGQPLLTEAIEDGKLEILRLLLEFRANPNIRVGHGMMEGQTPLFSAAMAASAEITRMLLQHGADPDAVNARGETVLMLAAGAPGPRSAEVVKTLIEKGAKVDARSDLGQTALMRAAMLGNLPAAKSLIEHGAKVNARSDMSRQLAFAWGFSGGPREEKAIQKLQNLGLLNTLHEDGPGALDMATSEELKTLLRSRGARSFGVEAQKRMQELMKLIGE